MMANEIDTAPDDTPAPLVFAVQGDPLRLVYRDGDARLDWHPLRNEQMHHGPIER